MLPSHSSFPLFPYTTLFRSEISVAFRLSRAFPIVRHRVSLSEREVVPSRRSHSNVQSRVIHEQRFGIRRRTPQCRRSEEHTSELQSPYDLVCRLLLEKKKRY